MQSNTNKAGKDKRANEREYDDENDWFGRN